MVDDLIRRARRRFLLNETLAQFAFAAAVVVAGFVLMLFSVRAIMGWWTLGDFRGGRHRNRLLPRVLEADAGSIRDSRAAGRKRAPARHSFHALYIFQPRREIRPTFLSAQRKQAEDVRGKRAPGRGGAVYDSAISLRDGCVVRARFRPDCACALESGTASICARPLRSSCWKIRLPRRMRRSIRRCIRNRRSNGCRRRSLCCRNWAWGRSRASPRRAIRMRWRRPSSRHCRIPPKPAQRTKRARAGPTKADSPKKALPANDSPGDPHRQRPGLGSGPDRRRGQRIESRRQRIRRRAPARARNSGSKESLLSRLKDAVSNMLSKSGQGRILPRRRASNRRRAIHRTARRDSRAKAISKRAQSQADGQDGQPDSDGQSGQQAQGKLNSKADTKPGQGGSGIGSQDGSKEIKAAEQLKAMGKISEIIGQRAATVSGETSVEVESGSQKLRTAYSNTDRGPCRDRRRCDAGRDSAGVAGLRAAVFRRSAEELAGETETGAAAPPAHVSSTPELPRVCRARR